MNVSDNIIHFYLKKHEQLFPTARLLLLRGTIPNMVYRSEAAQKQDFQPVIQTLSSQPESPIYAHLFSNSGAQQIGLLLRYWHELKGEKLPLRGMIFDSTPARGTFQRAFDGISYQIPSTPLLRIPGLAFIYVLVSTQWAYEKVSGKLNVVSQLNADLLDEGLIGEGVPRLYLYSKEDLLVRGGDVEWHAEMAAWKGWKVEILLFEESGHCRHGKGKGEQKYWEAVERMIRGGKRALKL